MRADDVVAAVVPLVDDAVGVDQVVVADVAPAAAVGVKVPDSAHRRRPVGDAVVGDGVVDDEVADRVVFQPVAVDAVGVAAPGGAADDERLGVGVGALRQQRVLRVHLHLQVHQFLGRRPLAGVDEGQAQLAQRRRLGPLDRRAVERPHLHEAVGLTGLGNHHHLADDLGLARLHPVVVGANGHPLAPRLAVGAGAHLKLDALGRRPRPLRHDGVERDGRFDDLGGEGRRGDGQLAVQQGRAHLRPGGQFIGAEHQVGHRVAVGLGRLAQRPASWPGDERGQDQERY